MNQPHQILFVINPKSGTDNKKTLLPAISTELDKKRFEAHIEFTEYAGHGVEIARKAVENNFFAVVAVGGDGTINEIGRSLINKKTALYMIPKGSGNGLARHLAIPLNPIQAIQHLNHAQLRQIDVGLVNGSAFFCTSGLGFDAHISSQFAQVKRRGIWGYIQVGLREYFRYKPEQFILEFDGQYIENQAVILTIANANQYGNNAFIAPEAHISDGLFDVCVVRPAHFFSTLGLISKTFTKNITSSSRVEIFRTSEILIHRANASYIHLDGDPIEMSESLLYRILPKSLNVLM